MRRTSFRHWPCSIARTVDLMGDWWTPLVLRESFFGARRFEELQGGLGIGRNILTERLRRLVDEGLLQKRIYQQRPIRYEYELTEKGQDFVGVLLAMMRWGDRWLDRGRGAPLRIRHHRCGALTHAEITCARCGERLEARDLDVEVGPGFPADSAIRNQLERRLAKSPRR